MSDPDENYAAAAIADYPRNRPRIGYIERLIRERDEARHDRDEALDYAQTIIETYMKERDEALVREKANFGRYIEASQRAEQVRAKAIDEAAQIAFARNLSIMSSTAVNVEARKIGNAILALKDKPTVQE